MIELIIYLVKIYIIILSKINLIEADFYGEPKPPKTHVSVLKILNWLSPKKYIIKPPVKININLLTSCTVGPLMLVSGNHSGAFLRIKI